jgi:hypothetical protein
VSQVGSCISLGLGRLASSPTSTLARKDPQPLVESPTATSLCYWTLVLLKIIVFFSVAIGTPAWVAFGVYVLSLILPLPHPGALRRIGSTGPTWSGSAAWLWSCTGHSRIQAEWRDRFRRVQAQRQGTCVRQQQRYGSSLGCPSRASLSEIRRRAKVQGDLLHGPHARWKDPAGWVWRRDRQALGNAYGQAVEMRRHPLHRSLSTSRNGSWQGTERESRGYSGWWQDTWHDSWALPVRLSLTS